MKNRGVSTAAGRVRNDAAAGWSDLAGGTGPGGGVGAGPGAGARHLDLGARASGSASTPGGDLYVVFGVEGMRLQARLTIPGHGAVTLYDPDGAELARSEGEGSGN